VRTTTLDEYVRGGIRIIDIAVAVGWTRRTVAAYENSGG
jgi:hypothetical protein